MKIKPSFERRDFAYRLYSIIQLTFFGIAAYSLSKKKQCLIRTLEPGMKTL